MYRVKTRKRSIRDVCTDVFMSFEKIRKHNCVPNSLNLMSEDFTLLLLSFSFLTVYTVSVHHFLISRLTLIRRNFLEYSHCQPIPTSLQLSQANPSTG